MKSTVYDVANKANVSVATVSRYLNQNSKISPEKVRAIESAIAALNYEPRKKRAKHRSMSIGVIAPTLNDPFSHEILQGIRDAASLFNYQLVVQPSYWNKEIETEILKKHKQQKVDAVIILVGFCPLEKAKKIMGDIPILYVCREKNSHFPVLWSDNVIGGRVATNHLLQLGHERIAHIMGGVSACGELSFDAIDRLQGYKLSLEAAGIPYDDRLVERGEFSLEGGYEAIRSLLRRRAQFTAIYAANDLSAFGAMQALNEFGLKVPDDVSVIGFDDHVMCNYYIPKLTTIKQPLYEIGQLSYQAMLDIMCGQTLTQVLPPFELKVRSSTTVPKAT